MSDEFDPNWPHGHLAQWTVGSAELVPARIIDRNLPGSLPIAAFIQDCGDEGFISRFDADGMRVSANLRLINAPAPVKHAEAWVNVWRDESGVARFGYHWPTLADARKNALGSTYIGAQRWSTDGTGGDIIGPNGEKVKL